MAAASDDAFTPAGRKSADPRKAQANRVNRFLKEAHPQAECALHHKNALQLLVATILSAQCTDERVNMVTPALFARFPDAAAFAAGPVEEIETLVQSTGFFRNKAKNIHACCQALCDRFHGEPPRTMEELVTLAGVGRKTASVLLGVVHGLAEGVVVDTHVARLSKRMGLTVHESPERIEADLMVLVPKKDWIDFSHRLIWHGRRVCNARSPKCSTCGFAPLCPKVGV